MRVRAHKNLHRDAWSLINPSTGLLMEHVAHIEMADVTFRVQKGGRDAVLRDGVRRVHAYVVGQLVAKGARRRARRGRWLHFTYNPFRAGTFVLADPHTPRAVYGAARVRLDRDGAYLQGPRFEL